MPVWFIGGSRDGVIAYRPGYVEAMAARLPDLRGTVLIEGAGHWTQQEAPEAFNRALLEALGSDASDRAERPDDRRPPAEAGDLAAGGQLPSRL